MRKSHIRLWWSAFFIVIISHATYSQSWIKAWQIYGPDKDEILGVTTDNNGNIYICGRYQDTVNFSSNVWFTGNPSYYDGFIARYDSSGALQWSRIFGGNNHDYASAICTDDSGYVYVACYGRSTTPIVFDSFSYTGTGNDKTFILKIDPSGNLVWGKLITSGISNAYPTSISVKNNTVAITGNYSFLDLIIDNDTLPNWGSDDIFLATYSAGTGNLLWTESLKSQFQDYANDVVLDDSGNVYLTGIFNSTFSLCGIDTFYQPYGYEIFLCKLDQVGQYKWAKRYNGTSDHMVDALKVNSVGDIYIAGWHASGNHILNDTSFSMLYAYNFFLQKVSPSGNSYWTRHFHGGSLGRIIGMAIDQADNVILSGYVGSQFNFDTIPVIGYNSDYRMFLSKIDGGGNVLAAIDGGNRVNNSGNNNIAVGNNGDVYAVGWFGTTTGQLCVFGDDTLTSAGESDGYIARYGLSGSPPCNVHAGFIYSGQTFCEGDSLQIIDTSLNAGTFRWFINGTEVSVVQNPVLQLPSAGYSTITLIASGGGCSDTTENVIFVNEKWHIEIFDTICQGETYLFNGNLLTTPGIYVSSHLTISGCDSVTTLHLETDSFSIAFSLYGDSAVATQGAKTYQWIDCTQGMLPVPGATNFYFTPTASGYYTVAASNGRCSDTAACQHIIVISVLGSYPEDNRICVYPVPARNNVIVKGLPQLGCCMAAVYTLSGELVKQEVLNTSDPVMDVTKLPSGNYILTIQNEGSIYGRFIISKE